MDRFRHSTALIGTAADVIDGLLAHGRSASSTQEAAELLGVPPEHVRVRMNPLVRQGKVFSPARDSRWRLVLNVEVETDL